MENPISFEHIEEYLEGQLSSADKEAFEKTLTTDPELSKRLEKHQNVHLALQSFARKQIEEEVADVYQKIKGSRVKTVQFPSWTYAMAAVFLVLCMLTVGYIWLRNQNSNPQLFAQQFTAHDLRQTTMGIEQPEDDVLGNFEAAYMSKNYEEAIKEGDLYLTLPDSMRTAEGDEAVQLGLAIAWLEEGNPAKAIEYLEKMTAANAQNDVARWYLGLAYLADDQTEEAKAIFQAIVDDPATNFKRSNAQELLEKLDSFWR